MYQRCYKLALEIVSKDSQILKNKLKNIKKKFHSEILLFKRTFFVSTLISKIQKTILCAGWLRFTILFFKVFELKSDIFFKTSSVFSSNFMKFPSLLIGHNAQNL